jgi:hypothetical protein
MQSNQAMKPTAPLRYNSSEVVAAPAVAYLILVKLAAVVEPGA